MLHGGEDAVDENIEELIFVLELAKDALLEVVLFLPGEGMGLEAMLEGIAVARLAAAFTSGRSGHDRVLSLYKESHTATLTVCDIIIEHMC